MPRSPSVRPYQYRVNGSVPNPHRSAQKDRARVERVQVHRQNEEFFTLTRIPNPANTLFTSVCTLADRVELA
jgi:hypothetical protein